MKKKGNIEHRTLNFERRRSFISRMARRNDDPNGVEEQSPAVARVGEGYPGFRVETIHHFRAQRGEQSEHIGVQCPNRD
jgi:hypothetical protein